MRQYRAAHPQKHREYNRVAYDAHKEERLEYQANYKKEHWLEIKERHKALKAQKQAIVREAKARPCADCGRTFPPVAMDFDHVRGVKCGNIAQLANNQTSVKKLLAELEKCEVVCACCHRVRTEQRRAG